MKRILAIAVLSASCALVASCGITTGSITPSPEYKVLSPNEIQIVGHPYKTAKDCDRRAPVGKFDAKCDIPVLGFRGGNTDVIVPQIGAPGGMSFGM